MADGDADDDAQLFIKKMDAIAGYAAVATKYNHHIAFVAKQLKFDSVGEFVSFLERLRKGGTGMKQDRTFKPNPSPYSGKIDLTDENNIIQFRVVKKGRKEGTTEERPPITGPTPDVTLQVQQYCIYGNRPSSVKLVPLDKQLEIIQVVTGIGGINTKYRDTVVQRRKEGWAPCIRGGQKNRYYYLDLPHIAFHYASLLGLDIQIDWTNEKDVPTKVLDKLRKELVILLECSYVMAPTREVSIIRRSSSRGNDQLENEAAQTTQPRRIRNRITTNNSPTLPTRKRRSAAATTSVLESVGAEAGIEVILDDTPTTEEDTPMMNNDDDAPFDEPPVEPRSRTGRSSRSSRARSQSSSILFSLDDAKEDDDEAVLAATRSIELNVLKAHWEKGEKEDYLEVGSLEIAIEEAYEGRTLLSCNAKIRKLNGIPRTKEEFEALKRIPDIGGRLRKFNQLKEDVSKALPEFLRINKDQSLLEWIDMEYRRQAGERLPRRLRETSQANSQPQLNDEVAHMIRHIIVCYNVPMGKFVGLLNCFAALLLGRHLEEAEFPSTSSIRMWIKRLSIVDRYQTSVIDRKTFGFTSKYGFPVLYHFLSDDTIHSKHDKRHGVIRTGVDENGRPKYVVLTSAKAVTSDAQGNSDLNLAVLNKNMHRDVLPFLGSATIDGAASAHCEATITVDTLMEQLKEKGDGRYRFYGVDRRGWIIPDFFHADNVTVNSASAEFSGEPEKGNSRQFHELQLLQSIHDLNIVNKDMSQSIMNDLVKLLGEDAEYVLRTVRQRKQRWRVNGLYAKRILKGIKMIIPDGKGNNLITHWAQRMYEVGGTLASEDSKWMKQTAMEIMIMSKSESVITSLTFEMELVSNYFDITHSSHAYSGEFKRRAGFITMELMFLFIDFVIPFWLLAVEDPAQCFPETVESIKSMKDDKQRELKMEQLQAAVEVGLEKISKNTELMLEPPLIFLLFTHPVEGPKVCRATLACLYASGYKVEEDDEIDFPEDIDIDESNVKFPSYTYTSLEEVPDGDRPYYAQLLPIADEVTHFARQLGLSRLCIRREMIELSEEGFNDNPLRRDANETKRLTKFKEDFPVIYDALFSAFGYSASNSRIIELLHGFVRSFWEEQTSMEFLDSKLSYLMGDENDMRDERRDISRDNRDPALPWAPHKHVDRKSMQSLQGKQLKNSTIKYSPEVIAALPDDIREEIKIMNIMKEGTTTMDKEYAKNVKEHYKKKQQKKIAKGANRVSFEEVQKKANEAQSEYDKAYHSKDRRNYFQVVDTVATKTHFSSMKVLNNGPFYDELIVVLPHLYQEMSPKVLKRDYSKKLRKIKKGEIMKAGGIVGNHLDRIRAMSKGEVGNTLDKTDLSNMSSDEIMAKYVLADKSIKLKQIEKDLAEKWKKVQDIYKSAAGTKIAPRFLKLMSRKVDDMEEEEEGDDEDDDEAEGADEVMIVEESDDDDSDC